MAGSLYELVVQIGSAIGSYIKPVGGAGAGGFDPDPTSYQPTINPGVGNATVAMLDSAGHLVTRGPVFTDEGSFRDDFPGVSLDVAPAGVLTFTPGSTAVSGAGTAFTSDLNRSQYIKLGADAASAFGRIVRIDSDTALTLAEPYTGAGGAGAATATYWLRTLTGGATQSVSDSEVALSSGGTSGALALIWRELDYMPIEVSFLVRLSGRNPQQHTAFGLRDNPAIPGARCEVIFEGENAEHGVFILASEDTPSATELASFEIPGRSDEEHEYKIVLDFFAARLDINGVTVATVNRHLPGIYTVLAVFAESHAHDTLVNPPTLYVNETTMSNQDHVRVVPAVPTSVVPLPFDPALIEHDGNMQSVKASDLETQRLLGDLLKQIKILNYQIAEMTGQEIDATDVE